LLLKNENKIEEALSMNRRIYNQIIFSGSFICATTHHKNERVRYLFAMKKKSAQTFKTTLISSIPIIKF
jgi:hypothetical protein